VRRDRKGRAVVREEAKATSPASKPAPARPEQLKQEPKEPEEAREARARKKVIARLRKLHPMD
jgi:hypothetical protein